MSQHHIRFVVSLSSYFFSCTFIMSFAYLSHVITLSFLALHLPPFYYPFIYPVYLLSYFICFYSVTHLVVLRSAPRNFWTDWSVKYEGNSSHCWTSKLYLLLSHDSPAAIIPALNIYFHSNSMLASPAPPWGFREYRICFSLYTCK